MSDLVEHCQYCGEPLESSKEIEENTCYNCMYFDDEGDPAERHMDEQMLINIGMGDC